MSRQFLDFLSYALQHCTIKSGLVFCKLGHIFYQEFFTDKISNHESEVQWELGSLQGSNY